MLRKIFFSFLTLLPFALSVPINAQDGEGLSDRALLARADSLFAAERYTQAFADYERLLESRAAYSPQALLKMAYVCEASDRPAKALYYLSLYYKRAADFEALARMAALAEERDLEGYRYSDYEYAATLFQLYYAEILFGGLGAFALLAGLLFVLRRNHDVRPAAFVGSLFLAAFYWALNFGFAVEYGITAEERVYLMDEPSAAGEAVAVVGKGHRLKLRGETDIWYEAVWDGGADPQTVYVRKPRLLRVR